MVKVSLMLKEETNAFRGTGGIESEASNHIVGLPPGLFSWGRKVRRPVSSPRKAPQPKATLPAISCTKVSVLMLRPMLEAAHLV